MSVQRNKKNGEGILEKMTMEELENIIKSDTPFIGEELDTDYIFKVLEVIEKREKESTSKKYNTNVYEAWESYKHNYKDLDDKAETLLNEKFLCYKDIKMRRYLARVASVILVLIAMIGSVSVASNIFNYNIWGAISKWEESTFGFVKKFSGLQEEKELHEKLAEYNITDAKIPQKILQNYNCTEVEVVESPKKIIFLANYQMDDKELTIIVNYLKDITSLTYEKNKEVEIYSKNDIRYYIMNNYEQLQAIWLYENCEYIIKGDISKTELKKIIDSI